MSISVLIPKLTINTGAWAGVLTVSKVVPVKNSFVLQDLQKTVDKPLSPYRTEAS